MTKRILWISDEIPDKDLGGGSIRQYHLLRAVVNHATVDLVVAGRLRDDDLRAALGNVVELSHPDPVKSSLRTWLAAHQPLVPGGLPRNLTGSRSLLDNIRVGLGETAEYDLVQVEHEQLATLIERPHSNKWVITFHNLLSVRLSQMAKTIRTRRGRWLAERDAEFARRFERQMVDGYDLAIAMSQQDADALGGRSVVIPNGVDLQRFRPTALPGEPRLLLSASFNWFPNVDGAQWFCSEVLPRVRAKIEDATLLLVGRQPDDKTRRLKDLPGVEAHFDVPSLVPYLAACRIALVPLRIGSGTRLKALEAMASGRPLAGTAIGLEGLGLRNGESAAVADEPQELADQIIELCRNDVLANSLAQAGRELAASQFGWERIADRYVNQVGSMIGMNTSSPAADLPT